MTLRSTTGRVVDTLPRPLDFIRWIKLKLGLVLVVSGAASLLVFWDGIGWVPPATSLTAIGVALLTSQILAHGMTRPLREMTAAARAMARGDYTRRVRATSRDEVGQLANAFNQMAADLAMADRQRRELIANVSHELRTPIFALQAVLENVVDGVEVPHAAMLQSALSATERLGRLVTDLLDLSRIDAGVIPLDRRSFDIDEFLRVAVREAEVNTSAAGRNVTFATDAVPSMAIADPARLHQVVANLLDNAARHSPPDGTVTAIARHDGDCLVIEVADEGPGIPVTERERVFERFTGGDAVRPLHAGPTRTGPALASSALASSACTGQTARARSGGTGLGLAIAQWIVELHGGSIAVVDTTGTAGPAGTTGPAGCRIQVRLPVAGRQLPVVG